jgi:hypothetical protein
MRPPSKNAGAWSLWIPVFLAFLLIIAGWIYTIQLALDNPTPQIPLEAGKEIATEN